MLCTFNRTLTASHPEGLYTLRRTDQLSSFACGSLRECQKALADELAEPALAMLADELALAMLLTGIA